MHTIDWQTVAAAALICWAVVYLLRTAIRIVGAKQKSTSCGSCGTCGNVKTSADTAPTPNFVAIDNLRRPS